MRLLWTCRRNLGLRGLRCRLLRLGRRRSRLFGSGRFLFCDHIEQHHRECLHHLFHGAAATAAQVLSHGRTHKWLSGYFYFAATLGIHTPIVFIASDALLMSRSYCLRRHVICPPPPTYRHRRELTIHARPYLTLDFALSPLALTQSNWVSRPLIGT